MRSVSRGIDRIDVTFDDPNLVANAGLILVATLSARLGLEALINQTVDLSGRVGGALPGRKILTLIHTMVAGGSHIDHADMLRAGATQAVLGFRVMAPSTLGTFLRSFTFGHIRQLDKVLAETIRRAWTAGGGPGADRLVIVNAGRKLERAPVPGQKRVGRDDESVTDRAGDHTGEPGHQATVDIGELRTCRGSLENGDLVTERDELGFEHSTRFAADDHQLDECDEQPVDESTETGTE